MNTVPQLTAAAITNIDGVANHPVYFITVGGNAPTVIVKGEQNKGADTAISLKWGSKLMKYVNDEQVNTKIMDPTEIEVFKARANHFLVGNQAKLAPLQEDLIWVKMPYVPGLSDGDVSKTDARGLRTAEAEDIKRQFRMFADEKIWKDLGRVLAVDCFNGNNDRFELDTGRWQNEGNLIFQTQGNAIKVIGLDTFDPSSQTANVRVMAEDSKLELNNIRSAAEMKAFADKCVLGVETRIKRNLFLNHIDSITVESGGYDLIITQNSPPGFFSGYTDALFSGISEGTQSLKIYLRAKKTKYGQVQAPPAGAPAPNAAPAGQLRPPPPAFAPTRPPAPGFQGVGAHRAHGQPAQPVPPQRHNKPLPIPGVPNKPLPEAPKIPQGILDKMAYLNW